jgi:hypothetical protein
MTAYGMVRPPKVAASSGTALRSVSAQTGRLSPRPEPLRNRQGGEIVSIDNLASKARHRVKRRVTA